MKQLVYTSEQQLQDFLSELEIMKYVDMFAQSICMRIYMCMRGVARHMEG